MPASQTQLQQRIAEIVPVDDKPHPTPAKRESSYGERRKLRGVLDEHQLWLRKRTQRAPQAKAQTQSIESGAENVGHRGQSSPVSKGRRVDAMNSNSRLVSD